LFHPNLIARKLGLTDKVEQTIIEQPLFNLDEPDGNDIDQEDIEA
jgi:hypothetical protein